MKQKQFAALPFRLRGNDCEILLITTRKKGRWSVPKGWPVKRASPHRTAAIEAYEEAGVHGAIETKQIGRFNKRHGKHNRSVVCDVDVYPLRVERQLSAWPEKQERSRLWLPPRKAAKLVKKAGLKRAIRKFERRQYSE